MFQGKVKTLIMQKVSGTERSYGSNSMHNAMRCLAEIISDL